MVIKSKNQNSIFLILLVLLVSCSNSQLGTLHEKYQPLKHFSPGKVWTSDAIGLVSEKGQYHLFFQFIPDSSKSGKLEWGHAHCQNLMDWQRDENVVLPDSLGEVLLSTTVIDMQNTSGLSRDGKSPWVALALLPIGDESLKNVVDFNRLVLAYSLDNGNTWLKQNSKANSNNSGMEQCRFPRIIWYAESQKWIMIGSKKDHVSFYSSTDLINWVHESDFGSGYGSHEGNWEYVDLYNLKVNGSTESRWVISVSVDQGALNSGSGTQYFTGNFNGHEFECIDEKPKWIDYGKDNYAGVTYQDLANGRCLFVGWMNNWQYANLIPASSWRGILTIPREISLVNSYNNYLLNTKPLRELQKIKQKKKSLKETEISGSVKLSDDFSFPIELELNFNTKNTTEFGFAEKFGIELVNDLGEKFIICYDNLGKFFYMDRVKAGNHIDSKDFNYINYAPNMLNEPSMDWRLIIDASSVELFAEDGLVVMTERLFPTEKFNHIKLFAELGKVTVTKGIIAQLKGN